MHVLVLRRPCSRVTEGRGNVAARRHLNRLSQPASQPQPANQPQPASKPTTGTGRLVLASACLWHSVLVVDLVDFFYFFLDFFPCNLSWSDSDIFLWTFQYCQVFCCFLDISYLLVPTLFFTVSSFPVFCFVRADYFFSLLTQFFMYAFFVLGNFTST